MYARHLASALILLAAAAACSADNADEDAADRLTGSSVAMSGDVSEGRRLFRGTCMTCHGGDARGIPGLGKSLVDSEFVDGLSDTELVEFIKVGRPVGDPLNTTGVDMLPRGGNPSLDDGDLLHIVTFIRSLN